MCVSHRKVEFAKREINEVREGILVEAIITITKRAISSLQSSVFWIINLVVVVICFLSGPFGTLEALPAGFRLIYWGAIVLTTSILALWIHTLIRTQNWFAFSKISFVSVVFGLLVSAIVIIISLSLLLPIERYPGHVELFSYSFPTATVTFLFSIFIVRSLSNAEKEIVQERPAIFKRLEKYSHAQKIISLSAQDHYVEVTTNLGSELCLLRLSDAIAEIEPENGFQIHRSHWVAKSAVVKLEAQGAAGQVELTDGRRLSVSQSQFTKFKQYLANDKS